MAIASCLLCCHFWLWQWCKRRPTRRCTCSGERSRLNLGKRYNQWKVMLLSISWWSESPCQFCYIYNCFWHYIIPEWQLEVWSCCWMNTPAQFQIRLSLWATHSCHLCIALGKHISIRSSQSDQFSISFVLGLFPETEPYLPSFCQ